MKPHRRKDTPPRREGGSGEHDSSSETDQPEKTEYVDPSAYGEDVAYDPGQALMDENQQYIDPNQQYVDPNQQYVDPNQQYVDPSMYSEPTPPPPVSPDAGVYDQAPPTPPAPQPTRKPVVKKKVVRRPAGQKRPVATGAAPYRRPRPVYDRSAGFSPMTVFVTLIGLALLAAIVFVVLPQDLSKIQGYPVNPLTGGTEPRNLLVEAQKVMLDRSSDLTLTEREVNDYLNHRLQGEQTGLVSSIVKFKGVYVDFSPGLAEIFIEREMMGLQLTMSSQIEADRSRGQVIYRSSGWTLGRVEFKSRNIQPIIEMFLRLRNTCRDEYQALRQMVDVKFEEDKVVLVSAVPS